MYTIVTRYHLEYPRVTNPIIQDSWLPWDMGPEVEFIMLHLVTFNSMPVSGIRNIFEPCKGYIAPSAKKNK